MALMKIYFFMKKTILHSGFPVCILKLLFWKYLIEEDEGKRKRPQKMKLLLMQKVEYDQLSNQNVLRCMKRQESGA